MLVPVNQRWYCTSDVGSKISTVGALAPLL